MYRIVRTKSFDKAYRKLNDAGRLTARIHSRLVKAIDILTADQSPDSSYADHALQGVFRGYRECHITNDMLLVYKKDTKDHLCILVEIGNHMQIFGD